MCIHVYNCLEPTVWSVMAWDKKRKKYKDINSPGLCIWMTNDCCDNCDLDSTTTVLQFEVRGITLLSTSMQRTPCMQNNAMHASPTYIVVLFYLKSPVLHLCVTRNVTQSVNSVIDNFSHHFCTQRYITFQVYSNECCQLYSRNKYPYFWFLSFL